MRTEDVIESEFSLLEYDVAKLGTLSLRKEIFHSNNKVGIHLTCNKLCMSYRFEVDHMLLPEDFRDYVRFGMNKGIKSFNKKAGEVLARGGMYHVNEFGLSYEEEMQLAEELRKVKEGFYANVQRDKKGNRVPKDYVDLYKKLESFGEF